MKYRFERHGEWYTDEEALRLGKLKQVSIPSSEVMKEVFQKMDLDLYDIFCVKRELEKKNKPGTVQYEGKMDLFKEIRNKFNELGFDTISSKKMFAEILTDYIKDLMPIKYFRALELFSKYCQMMLKTNLDEKEKEKVVLLVKICKPLNDVIEDSFKRFKEIYLWETQEIKIVDDLLKLKNISEIESYSHNEIEPIIMNYKEKYDKSKEK